MSICKYCQKVELSFNEAYKSKTGRLIPLDKTSGLPHQCSESPYTKQQSQHVTETAYPSSSSVVTQSTEEQQLTANIALLHKDVMDRMLSLENKLDHISRLIYAITNGEQKQQQAQPQQQK
jgi:hypothetical protein